MLQVSKRNPGGVYFHYESNLPLDSGESPFHFALRDNDDGQPNVGKYRLNAKHQIVVPNTGFLRKGYKVVLVGLGDYIGLFKRSDYEKHKEEIVAIAQKIYQSTE